MKNERRQSEILIGVLFALAVWQAAAMLIDQQIILASPIQVAVRLGSIWREEGFLRSVLFSFLRILGGFSSGLALGIIFAVLAGRFHAISVLVQPFITVMKTIPVASFIVVSLIWFGSDKLAIFISFVMVFPIIYTNVLEGIRSTDPQLLEMAKVFRVPHLKKLLYIYLPCTMPQLVSGCSVALGLAWKSGIAAEVIGIPDGSIGERLYQAKLYLDTDDLFAWTVIIIALSIGFERLFTAALRYAAKRLTRM